MRIREPTTAVPAIREAPFEIPGTPTEAELLSKYFRVLSDPTRLRIVESLVEEGELSVGDLVKRLGVSQPSVSNHLACLRWCGFVEARREHRVVYNRVADPGVARLVGLARSLLEGNAEHVAACRRA
jgi:ArsR family transcriptional regulator, cadmium/lead-responsive transcriptional repressor